MTNPIEEAFSKIPVERIIKIANTICLNLETNHASVELKEDKEYVTKADIEIQAFLLNYFKNSALQGSYFIKAEEKLSAEEQIENIKSKQYQLIIDPLDGTNAFCKGEDTWGTMVGLCDKNGQALYSWNMLSNGSIFSSATAKQRRNIYDWNKSLQINGTLNIDVYDYGAGAASDFPYLFELTSNKQVSADQIKITSYPAAVWAGWGLYNGQLNGLLWLPSHKGKCRYPDYDLIFLGALKDQGWKVAIGKQQEEALMIVVAPTENEREILWDIGSSMIRPERSAALICDKELHITSPLRARSK